MANWKAPHEWNEWQAWLAAGLQSRSRRRLAVVMMGMLFARGRRTVTSWLRAAGITTAFPGYYYFNASVGRKVDTLAKQLLLLVLRCIKDQRVLLAIDDTPTKRYGPKVQGAGRHHNPTPGPAEQPYLYGHIWVTLAWVVRHKLWGTIGLPLLARLYVRQVDIDKIPKKHNWTFETKIYQAIDLLRWAAETLQQAGKNVWLVVDGFYGKSPLLKTARELGVTVVGRLRKDAGLRSVPKIPPKGKRRPGAVRKYGEKKISLAKRAGHRKGWQTLECFIYGQLTMVTYKSFLATYKPARGLLRIVLIREDYRGGWLALFCTDPDASVREIVESFADRAAIEQVFHDVKEVWGAGKQQVRNIWANLGVYHLNLWMHTLVELWSWKRSKSQLCNRKASPWDDPDRRPSHADRRNALRVACLREELTTLRQRHQIPRKIVGLVKRLTGLSI